MEIVLPFPVAPFFYYSLWMLDTTQMMMTVQNILNNLLWDKQESPGNGAVSVFLSQWRNNDVTDGNQRRGSS